MLSTGSARRMMSSPFSWERQKETKAQNTASALWETLSLKMKVIREC